MTGLLAFCGLVFVASITPGPTNLILLVQGMRSGVMACGSFILGASAGAAGVLWIAVWLAGAISRQTVQLTDGSALTGWLAPLLSMLAALWLSWLAWQIWCSRDVNAQTTVTEISLGWRSGTALQLINPKTWGTAIAVAAIYGMRTEGLESSVLALIFFVITLPCLFSWAMMGRWLARLQHWLWLLNPALAVLLLLTAWSPLLPLILID